MSLCFTLKRTCIVSILPLALTLFAIFLLVKLALGGCDGLRGRTFKEPLQ